jgi:aspartate/glutamate racemase
VSPITIALWGNDILEFVNNVCQRIAQRLKDEDGIEALVLAGTELPLILRESAPPGIKFLDTTAIHVDAAVIAS